jgi:uncharacterized membrane protein YccC
MTFNVGTADRIVRLILGVALAALALFSGLASFTEPLWFWGALSVSAILIVTAIVRFCPLYAPFGVSTCKVSR